MSLDGSGHVDQTPYAVCAKAALLLLVPGLFLLKRDLLFDKRIHRILLIISVVLFCTGLLHYFWFLRYGTAWFATVPLLAPLIALKWFDLALWVFRRYHKRDPIDTLNVFSFGLAWDRAFNFLYWVVSFWICLWLMYLLDE